MITLNLEWASINPMNCGIFHFGDPPFVPIYNRIPFICFNTHITQLNEKPKNLDTSGGIIFHLFKNRLLENNFIKTINTTHDTNTQNLEKPKQIQ